jgi:hypothetical protein
MTIDVSGHTLFEGGVSPDLIDYTLDVPSDAVKEGTLDVHIITNAFSAPGDTSERDLGVTLTRVMVEPGSHPDRFVTPPTGVAGALVGAVAILGLALAILGWGAGGVAAGAILLGTVAAGLLVFDRIWLTSGGWYWAWPQALIIGALSTWMVDIISSVVFRLARVDWWGWARSGLLTAMLVAFAVRLAGQFHPQIFIVDLLFHVHRFEIVESGRLLFMTQPAEWANHSTFYLPTAYVYMLPLQAIINDMASAIRITMVALGTAGAVPVFFIAARVVDRRAGVIAAYLYLVFPISVLLFSWGILTNIFGEFFALLTLALFVGAGDRLDFRKPAYWSLVFVLTMALLSHPGVVQLISLAVAALVALLWLARKRLGGRANAGWTLAAFALSWVISYAIYYWNFVPGMIQTLGDITRERAAASSGTMQLRVGGGIGDRSLGLTSTVVHNWSDWFWLGLQGFWNEARAYYRAWPLAGAVLACMVIWPTKHAAMGNVGRARTRLVLSMAAWTVAIGVLALVGWLANLYVRYSLFALPLAALGSGIVLSLICRRGWAGRWVALLVVIFFAVEAVGLWQYRINYGLK